MLGYGRVDTVFDTVEKALAGCEYVVGDSFTAADLYLASHLGWGMQFGTIEKRPVFEDYVRRMDARPASVRAVEIDDALIPAEQRPPVPA
jgi:glutathione S-transferase